MNWRSMNVSHLIPSSADALAPLQTLQTKETKGKNTEKKMERSSFAHSMSTSKFSSARTGLTGSIFLSLAFFVIFFLKTAGRIHSGSSAILE
jgi:hypothetical protein